MGTSAPTTAQSTGCDVSGSTFGVSHGQGSDGSRVAAPGHSAACQRNDRPDAAATGGDHRPRTGAHPPPRLSDQSAAGGGRNPALLSSGSLVGLGADSPGTGTLL